MSGGSYDYLFTKDLLPQSEDVRRMAERLRALGYDQAAADTARIVSAVEDVDDGLREVWRAVEWLDSCDSGPEAVARAVEKRWARKRGQTPG